MSQGIRTEIKIIITTVLVFFISLTYVHANDNDLTDIVYGSNRQAVGIVCKDSEEIVLD